MKKILVLTKYEDLGASSRLRFLQYIDKLSSKQFKFVVSPLLTNEYVKSIYNKESIGVKYLLIRYIKRLRVLLQARDFDYIWLEKEFFPGFPSIFEFLLNIAGVKIITDYDDATFHHYDESENKLIKFFLSKKIDKVMSFSNIVVCGNEYIQNRALRNNKNVILIPTVIDHQKYIDTSRSSNELHDETKIKIGWIGTPNTQKFIESIIVVLDSLSIKYKIEIVLIGANPDIVNKFKSSDVQIIKWTEESEIFNLNSIDFGIMPLTNRPWDRGKCGYKLIQYMGCGKPVIGSDVGVNKYIIDKCKSGFIANDLNEWAVYLEALITNQKLRESLSSNALYNVKRFYSVDSQIHKIKSMFS